MGVKLEDSGLTLEALAKSLLFVKQEGSLLLVLKAMMMDSMNVSSSRHFLALVAIRRVNPSCFRNRRKTHFSRSNKHMMVLGGDELFSLLSVFVLSSVVFFWISMVIA